MEYYIKRIENRKISKTQGLAVWRNGLSSYEFVVECMFVVAYCNLLVTGLK